MYKINIVLAIHLLASLNIFAMEDFSEVVQKNPPLKIIAASAVARELVEGNQPILEKVAGWEETQTHDDEIRLIRGALISQNLDKLAQSFPSFELHGHRSRVEFVKFSEKNDYAITLSFGSPTKILVWDTTTKPFSLVELPNHRGSQITAATFNEKRDFLLLGLLDGAVLLYNLAQNSLQELESHTSQVRKVCFSDDGKYATSESIDSVHLWKMEDLSNHIVISNGSCLKFSPNSNHLAGIIDRKLKIMSLNSWNVSENTIVSNVSENTIVSSDFDLTHDKYRCHFSSAGNYLYVTKLKLFYYVPIGFWDLSGKEIISITIPEDYETIDPLPADMMKSLNKSFKELKRRSCWNVPYRNAIIYSPDGKYSLSIQGSITKLQDLITKVAVIIQSTFPISDAEFSVDSNYIISGVPGGMRVVDLNFENVSIMQLLEIIRNSSKQKNY